MMTVPLSSHAKITSKSGTAILAVHKADCPTLKSDHISDCKCDVVYSLRAPKRRATR